MNTLQPIQENDRIEHIDIIRGIAILGILLVNMAHFSYPDLYLHLIGPDNFFVNSWGALDQFTNQLLHTFIQMKFITMFSFLFGFGMIIMMERSKLKGQKFVPLYARRLLALLLFGVIHAFFIWDGDILTEYALLGFVLLLFRNCQPKTLLVWTIICYSLFALPVGLVSTIPFEESTEMIELNKEIAIESEQNAKQALHTYSEGTFIDVAKQRIHDRMFYMSLNGMASLNPILYFYINIPYFSMFLLGAYFAKRKLLHQPSKHKSTLKKIWIISLLIGLPTNILYGFTNNESFLLIGAPFLMLFYIISTIFLMKYPWGRKVITPFSAVGRTAFTNYILQSIIATTIFYSYGFALYGKVNPFLGLLITLAIFSLQLIISNVWLQFFKYGPLEWVWRTITYMTLPRFKIK